MTKREIWDECLGNPVCYFGGGLVVASFLARWTISERVCVVILGVALLLSAVIFEVRWLAVKEYEAKREKRNEVWPE